MRERGWWWSRRRKHVFLKKCTLTHYRWARHAKYTRTFDNLAMSIETRVLRYLFVILVDSWVHDRHWPNNNRQRNERENPNGRHVTHAPTHTYVNREREEGIANQVKYRIEESNALFAKNSQQISFFVLLTKYKLNLKKKLKYNC